VTQHGLNACREALRPEWMFDFVVECQRLVGHSIHPPLRSQLSILNDFVQALPDPQTPAEESHALGLLLSAAVHWGNRVHSLVHPGQPGRCRFDPSSLLETLVRHDGRSSKASFGDWAARYVAAFEAEHQLTSVFKLADILERRYGDALDLRQLIRKVDAHPRTLERAFRDTLGLSVHEYITRVRVAHAIPALCEPGSNVDAVARNVGYKSTKNLYRPLRRWAGLTPGQLRALPADEADRLIQTIRRPLVNVSD
jgi:AraC-like DNA-binding protein